MGVQLLPTKGWLTPGGNDALARPFQALRYAVAGGGLG